MYFPKDFIATAEGLLFAVVVEGFENQKILCFLRYVQTDKGWLKLSTDQANDFLQRNHPEFLFYSTVREAHLHAVRLDQVIQHYQPRQRLQQLLKMPPTDAVIEDLLTLLHLFQEQCLDLSQVGITGSVLIGVQRAASDLDLVIYDQQIFQQARQIVQTLMARQLLQPLTEDDWQEAYQRRDCAIEFDDYVWHERRKWNKAMINQRKVDLSLLLPGLETYTGSVHKLGPINAICKVTDTTRSFAYPAEYSVDADAFDKIVCYTATYSGQALVGETVEIAGQLEMIADGKCRVVVGSSREARGEFIRVLKTHVNIS